jgi:hypothetical protein
MQPEVENEVAFELQNHIPHFVRNIAATLQRLYPRFRDPATQWEEWQCFTAKWEGIASGKSKMAAAKPEVLISRLTDQLGTSFQRQNLCFRGVPSQWHIPQCCNTDPEVEIQSAILMQVTWTQIA